MVRMSPQMASDQRKKAQLSRRCTIIVGSLIVAIAAFKSLIKILRRAEPQSTLSIKPFRGNDDPIFPKPWAEDELDWWALHRARLEKINDSDALPTIGDTNSTIKLWPQLLFYGDSITEGWEGTNLGNVPRSNRMWVKGEDQSMRDVFHAYFGTIPAVKPPLTLGASGDQTQHLLWRLQNGELPSSKNGAIPMIAIVMIGTNNLGAGMFPNSTLLGIAAVCRYLLQNGGSKMDLLISELFPRHDSFRLQKLCPPRCNPSTGKSFESFVPAIRKVNAGLAGLVEELKLEFSGRRIAISYCGGIFTNDDEEIMPDHLHPNSKGQDLWAKCLLKDLFNLTANGK